MAPRRSGRLAGSQVWDVGGLMVIVTADGHAVLPEGMTELPPRAFRGRTTLVSVACPRSLISIGEEAFFGCTSLVYIDFSASLTLIGPGAFENCSSLRSITLPDSLTSIRMCAFWQCSSLTRAKFPAGLTSIGEWSFGCTPSLNRVTLPTTAVLVPESVSNEDAFDLETTTITYLPPTSMRAQDRLFFLYKGVVAYQRCRPGLLGWLERVQIKLGSYGPDGAARKRDREAFERDFAHSASS